MISSQPRALAIPTTPSPPCDNDVAMLSPSPVRGLKIKLKRPSNAANTNDVSAVPAGANPAHQQPASGTEPSAALDQVRLDLTKEPRLIPAFRMFMRMLRCSRCFKFWSFRPGSVATGSRCRSRSARMVRYKLLAQNKANLAMAQILLRSLSSLPSLRRSTSRQSQRSSRGCGFSFHSHCISV